MDKEIFTQGHRIKISNWDKLYWPEDQVTKGELVEYYLKVAPYILPYLEDRPLSLNRFPEGIHGEHFYQKNILSKPDWVKTFSIYSASTGDEVNYLICNDIASMAFALNLGNIEMHVRSARVNSLKKPDYLVIDLDPLDVDFMDVVKASLVVKEVFDDLKIKCYPKTSGASGLHVYVPLGAKYTFDQVRQFAEIVSALAYKRCPELLSLERLPKNRYGKVYLDFLQNREGATMASPYSVRPLDGAPVSAPLEWSEVKEGLNPASFTIRNIFNRLESKGDIFAPVLQEGISLSTALEHAEKLLGNLQ